MKYYYSDDKLRSLFREINNLPSYPLNQLNEVKLNKLLRNPAEILIIQDELSNIKHNSILADCFRVGSIRNISETIKHILKYANENRQLMSEMIGEKTLKMIEKFAI